MSVDVHELAVLRGLQWREYEDTTIQHVIPYLVRQGAQVLGLWYTIIGQVDEAVMITRYRDLAHWERVHQGGEGSPAERRAFEEALEHRSGLCTEETAKLMEPSALAHGVKLDLEGRKVFANRTQHLVPGGWAEYERITATEMWPRLIPRGAEPVGLWRTLVGRANEANLLTQYKDMAAWESTHPAHGAGEGDNVDPSRQRRKGLFRGEHVRIMLASRYRP